MTEKKPVRTKETEIDQNLDFFLKQLPTLLKDNKGKYVLIRNQEIVGIYDTVRDAQLTGEKFFKDGLYSVQKVDDTSINLGFYSHAMCMAAT